MDKNMLFERVVKMVNMYVQEEKDCIIRVGSYFMEKEMRKEKPLYKLNCSDNGQLELEKIGVITDTYSIKDYLKLYTGNRLPSYCGTGEAIFEQYERIVSANFMWYTRCLYSDIINQIYPDLDEKIQFCKIMEWDTDSPNPEYVSELLELYEHTDAYKAGVSPFDVFPEYKECSIGSFIKLSDRCRHAFDNLLCKCNPSYSQFRMVAKNS